MKTFEFYRRHLPHFRLKGSTYFITWRIGSAIGFLSSDERTIVVEALRYFDGSRYDLVAWVVMDDHVHVVVCPREGSVLAKIVHTWKGFTARRINDSRGRSGPCWQQDYFDRIIRDDDEFQNTVAYVLNNPKKRWPELEGYLWVGENDVQAACLRARAGSPPSDQAGGE